MKKSRVRTVIAFRQPMFRRGIEQSLSEIEDIEICSSGDCGKEILAILEQLLPDVIIVDIDETSEDGFKIVRDIKLLLPNIGIIVVSGKDEDDRIFQALKSQAAAYLTRQTTTQELVDTVRRVAVGEYPINEALLNRPKVAGQIVEQFQKILLHNDEGDFMSPLTLREIEVLDFVAQGYPNKQIASSLDISEQTIKNHVTSVLRKLNANSRTEAVVQAIKKGIISVG